MGDRIQGVVGLDPLTAPDERSGPGESPGAGFADPRPLGMNGGNPVATSGTLRMVGWPRNVAWREFTEMRARPPGEDEDAQIQSEAEPLPPSVVSENGVFRVRSLTVRLRTVPGGTWVVKGTKTADLLSHEQGHFDLTGLNGRDLGNEILAARASSPDELQSIVTDLMTKYQELADDWTERYDNETDHSRNRDAQARWDTQIQQAKATGKSFSPP